MPEADYGDGERTPPGASTPEEVAIAPISGRVARTRSASPASRSAPRPALLDTTAATATAAG
eukprot:1749812-Prorocentrum_lima.AAC.1